MGRLKGKGMSAGLQLNGLPGSHQTESNLEINCVKEAGWSGSYTAAPSSPLLRHHSDSHCYPKHVPAPSSKALASTDISWQKPFWRRWSTSSINNYLINTAATHSFKDIRMWGEPNVPPPQPFGIIHDGISIKISAMSEGGWGNEWYNMNGESNKYSHKYGSMALSDVQPYREWESEILECFQVKWSTTSVMYLCIYLHTHTNAHTTWFEDMIPTLLSFFHSTGASETSRASRPRESSWQLCWVQTFANMRFQRACFSKESVNSLWWKDFALWNCLFALNVMLTFIHIHLWILER